MRLPILLIAFLYLALASNAHEKKWKLHFQNGEIQSGTGLATNAFFNNYLLMLRTVFMPNHITLIKVSPGPVNNKLLNRLQEVVFGSHNLKGTYPPGSVVCNGTPKVRINALVEYLRRTANGDFKLNLD